MIKTIYLDMDGVLADFDKEFFNRHGITVDECRAKDGDIWKKFVENRTDFYRTMPTYHGMNRMVSDIEDLAKAYGYKVEILTAIPRMTTYPTAAEEKREWLVDNDLGHLKVNLGPHSADKHKHCKYNDILIDDNSHNIRDWKAAGGIGILFKNGHDSVAILLDFLDMTLLHEQRLARDPGF